MSSFDESFVTANITTDKLIHAGGNRYLKARRPELYSDIIGQNHNAEQKIVWLNAHEKNINCRLHRIANAVVVGVTEEIERLTKSLLIIVLTFCFTLPNGQNKQVTTNLN
ncbi:MAG: hypothetical protein ABIU77_00125, partial [Ferruginibacter sp.]